MDDEGRLVNCRVVNGLLHRVVEVKSFDALALDVVAGEANNVGAVPAASVLLSPPGAHVAAALEVVGKLKLSDLALRAAVNRHVRTLGSEG